MRSLEELVCGSIDMHAHFGPDSNFARRLDAFETVRHAQEMGLQAIVLKSHDYPTAPLARIISRFVTTISVFGGIALDFESGGLNPHAVECSAKMGCKVLWMPTLSSANSRTKISRLFGLNLKGEGISILDAEGELLPEVKDIIEIAKKYDMVIASGHISPQEVFKMVDFAQENGPSKLLITHAICDDAMEKTLNLNEQQQLGKRGVFMEYCLVMSMPIDGRLDPARVVQAIRTVGAEHCIISSDFGQAHYPPPAEGIRMFIGILRKLGLKEEEIELISKINPARLLGIG